MVYMGMDTFYLTDEELRNSPSRKHGIDETTDARLRLYGCELIQESGILLRLPQAVMATGQVFFHRFYCKKSFARFDVKRVAAGCVWLASKLEESPREPRHVVDVFRRMEYRRENLPFEYLEKSSEKYQELEAELFRAERYVLKEVGFICHVELPHRCISAYLDKLETPPEVWQEAWNLANDSLRTNLCVRFKSEVVACGVVYAAARRFQVPLPENPPWWEAFDADKSGIDEVCRVLAHLYALPKARYVQVSNAEGDLFKSSDNKKDSPTQTLLNEDVLNHRAGSNDTSVATTEPKPKDLLLDVASARVKETEKNSRREDREREKLKARDGDRGRHSDRERYRENTARGKDGHGDKSKDTRRDPEKSRHHSTRDCDDYYSSSHSSRKKHRQRHHPYTKTSK